MAADPIRIFIGSGEQSLLERKVLIYSLRKNSKRELDIHVFNGTHNAIERNTEPPKPAPMPLHLKYRNKTEFSLYRYLLPELCSHQGRAIYLDSDMVCLTDIGKLYDTPLDEYDFRVKPQKFERTGEMMWGSSVMLVDCERTRFNLEQIFQEIDQGLYTYTEFVRFTKKFIQYHPYRIGELDPHWNVFDRADSHTNLIHYTNLLTQPWKYTAHPYGRIWFSYFYEARRAGHITNEDISLTVQRGYVRPNVGKGNSPLFVDKVRYCLKKWTRETRLRRDDVIFQN
jgi:lipopolysaccharide biosynthesis glycosyltransferase